MKLIPESFTRGPAVIPRFPTITAAFYHHATFYPEDLAAIDISQTPPTQITYGALSLRVIALSRKLRNAGIKPGDRVPLVVKRSIDMLVGIYAILSAGAQYVPLDGGVVPDSTVRLVVEQSASRLVLCMKSTRHRLAAFEPEREVIAIDELGALVPEYDAAITSDDFSTPTTGCYVIYTSGTTGTPKGVDVTHQNVVNLVCQSPGDLGIARGTRVGQVLNIGFDMAAWEILGCLSNGGTLVLRGSDWNAVVAQIDTFICTPSILALYEPSQFPNIKTVATAGEPSSQSLADRWSSHGVYYNCCGPTETTIVNTMHKHTVGADLTIGRPTPNNSVYILDDSGNPVAVGETGIMWAGGHGISRGYIDLPEKTAEKYRIDPFANNGSMMYNTGDLGRWRADGTIEPLGRIDDQIKIKGFRVELDGVTASLIASPTVTKGIAVFLAGEIHAFVTPTDADPAKIKAHMGKHQPYYAIPSHFHGMKALPLTANGKVDKKALGNYFTEKQQVMAEVKAATLPRAPSSTFTLSHSRSTSLSTLESLDEKPEKLDLNQDIPAKLLPQPFRGLFHRLLIVYRQLFTVVTAFNLIAVGALVFVGPTQDRLALMTAVNLSMAVLIRQDFVINALYTVACSVPKSWPLGIRKRCAKIYHLGGVHSAAAIFSALWLLASSLSDAVCGSVSCSGWARQSLAPKVISWLLCGLYVVMMAFAWPSVRKSRHNLFEMVHRFVGWTMLGLFWAQVVLATNDSKATGMTLGEACARNPSFWLLAVASMSIVTPWLFLRKVTVDAEPLSNHAVRLHFDYTVPVNGTFTRLSKRPLLEWHSFATIPAPEPVSGRPKGYSLVVSNAGDWTKACINNQPTKIWVRGVPTCGVMRIATLFNRLVVIATGSGIGPLLGHLQDPSCPTKLLWSTKDPENTFGDMYRLLKEKAPDAVVHDTKLSGRPDLVKMGYNLAKSFGAEGVIIIANEKITRKVVYGLESRGMPAYGAIWDS
ncbi:AMP-binding enzyme [Microdochium trichocladiopsis]|uniref:AMP-binding enzyme n=1 Tax=Microdochium trichocladiopsis TaxID=1682393 RepID=A0A9P9BKQ7_9PEZI|nr:AMP-binding enzyme [Microdochium trichocladiopsis]KAH7027292.1 AMP-binding enzyme [Microdochium trichocladiopsis]